MKRILPSLLIFAGVILFFVGIAYDVMFAGIPYQDPIPSMAASYNFHVQVVSIIRWGGVSLSKISGAVIIKGVARLYGVHSQGAFLLVAVYLVNCFSLDGHEVK